MENGDDIENAIKDIAGTRVANLNPDRNTGIEFVPNLSIILLNNN